MGNGTGGPATPIIRPSPALTVTVWPGRLELPVLGWPPIGRAQLELIQAYASGRHETIRAAAEAATGDPMDEAFHELSRTLLLTGGLVKVDPHADDRAVIDLDAPPRPGGGEAGAASAAGSVRAGEVRVRTPLSIRPRGDRFELVSHDGAVLVELDVAELALLPRLARDPSTTSTRVDVDGLLDRLARHRLVVAVEPGGELPALAPDDAAQQTKEAFAAAAVRADERERDRERRTGVRRVPVVPVSFTLGPPLALGLIVAYCAADEEHRLEERYELRHDWEWDDDRLEVCTERPAIYLCSAYVWSHVQVLRVAQAVKGRSPASVVIVGGPDAPKREGDARTYLDAHPEVDVIVRGEGEQTALELLAALTERPDGTFDLSRLTDVAGITVRLDGAVVRTPERERLSDLDVLPSPFLTGRFDTYLDAPLDQVILESNRGCPYGCTFCDWGSATQSRIRSFDLDRVLGEVEWSARAHAKVISFADANFGIFARDIEIAERIASVRAATSYPVGFGANFAKNTVKHLRPIIRALVDGGIVNRGLLALQTMDEGTLATIERANIKVERYDAIAAEMRAAGLPFAVELMMGLPGATVESFMADLQQCIDREVEGTVNPTTVLVNSPMNAPAYRAEHAIETAVDLGPGSYALIVSTSTFTRADYLLMGAIRRTFLLGENFGVTRHIDRLVRAETGTREIDFLVQLRADVVDDPDRRHRYPFLRHLLGQPGAALVTPASWRFVVDDLVAYVLEVHPDIDPAALATAASVQHALLPAFDREYPLVVELEHDYAAWFARIVEVKEQGHGDRWTELVPPLTSFGPGVLHVDDPTGSARRNIGCSVDHGPLLASWEHHSEVGRILFAAAPAG